jgi:hypothetical protein
LLSNESAWHRYDSVADLTDELHANFITAEEDRDAPIV